MNSLDKQIEEAAPSLNCLTEWMRFILSEDRHYYRQGVSVQIFGEGDSSYAVFERDVSSSPAAVDQYVLLASDPERKLFSLLCFLAESGFELASIMSRLEAADYSDENGARFKHVTATYSRVTEVKS
ncbi:MAG TPA: hypothetical protein VF453_14390 [Burkholderiaceae bacterium]